VLSAYNFVAQDIYWGDWGYEGKDKIYMEGGARQMRFARSARTFYKA